MIRERTNHQVRKKTLGSKDTLASTSLASLHCRFACHSSLSSIETHYSFESVKSKSLLNMDLVPGTDNWDNTFQWFL